MKKKKILYRWGEMPTYYQLKKKVNIWSQVIMFFLFFFFREMILINVIKPLWIHCKLPKNIFQKDACKSLFIDVINCSSRLEWFICIWHIFLLSQSFLSFTFFNQKVLGLNQLHTWFYFSPLVSVHATCLELIEKAMIKLSSIFKINTRESLKHKLLRMKLFNFGRLFLLNFSRVLNFNIGKFVWKGIVQRNY